MSLTSVTGSIGTIGRSISLSSARFHSEGSSSSLIHLSTMFSTLLLSIFITTPRMFSPSSTRLLSSYMISLWSLLTWSYSRRFLRIPKLLFSIFFWAFSIALESILCSICSPSGILKALKRLIILSEPKSLIISSSSEI